MMTIAYIVFLTALFVYLFFRAIRAQPQSLTLAQTALAFGARVIAGIVYGYVFRHYFGGDDTWGFHGQSLDEYQKLVHHPGIFFSDLLPTSAIAGAPDAGKIIPFYIMDLENALLPKLLAVFNIFSRGNYYVNVVFFEALLFFGPLMLYRYLAQRYPGNRRGLYILIFLFPPALFWLSGIRADGLLFLFLILAGISFHRMLLTNRLRPLWTLLPALLGILIFRDELLFLLGPALLGWSLAQSGPAKPWRAWKRFALVYLGCGLLFFGSSLLSVRHSLPAIVASRQQSFFALHGNTRYTLDSLDNSPLSYVRVLPQALANTFFRPYIWEARGPLQVVSALEVISFWIFVIWFGFPRGRRRGWRMPPPGILAMVFFAVSLYLFIGCAVPFPGAIVRYRIIGELSLMLAVYLAPFKRIRIY